MKNVEIINGYKVRYPGRLIELKEGNQRWYLDQLIVINGIDYPDDIDELTEDMDTTWINGNKIENYLISNYGINSQKYYELIINRDINHITTCWYPKCSNPVRFLSLGKGYNYYCSPSCCASDHWENDEGFKETIRSIHESQEYKDYLSKIHTETWSNPEYKDAMREIHRRSQGTEEYRNYISGLMTEKWKDPDYAYTQAAKISKGSALFNLENSESNRFYLYGALTKFGFKIGISSRLSEIRSYQVGIDLGISSKLEFVGPGLEVINFEYDFKMKYKSKSLLFSNIDCDMIYWSELFTFDNFDQMLSELKSHPNIKPV